MFSANAIDDLESLDVRCRQSHSQPVRFEVSSGRRFSAASRYRRSGKSAQSNNGVHRRSGKRYGL
jgi:hypothetical protein